MQKRKISFSTLLLILGLLPLTIGIIVATVFSVNKLDNSIKEETFKKLNVAATNVIEFYVWDITHNCLEYDDYSYIDSEKVNDIELTLFEGDTRVITSINKESSTERNIGTVAEPEIYEKVKAGETVEKDHVKIGEKEYFVTYKPLYVENEAGKSQFWGMGFAGTPEDDVNKLLGSVRLIMILLALTIIGLSSVAVVFISIRLKKPIEEAADKLSKLSEGDIHINADITSPVKELDNIAISIKTLVSSLQETIDGVKGTANTLAGAVSEVDSLAETNSGGVGQISEAVNELATTAQSMAESVQDTANQTIQMGTDIEDIGLNIKSLSTSSEHIMSANNEASKYMQSVLDSSKESVLAVNEISEQISETNKKITKINEAVKAIQDIASQTSLLALNASIEAARAGEAGRGFAVVAEEISKLASDSQKSSEEIDAIVLQILESSQKSVESAHKVNETIEKEQNFIKDTQNKFSVLSEHINKSVDEIDMIFSKTEMLNKTKASITQNISDLSAISEQNGASAEEVSATCTTISEGVSDTRAKSEEMAAMSEYLLTLVGYFT